MRGADGPRPPRKAILSCETFSWVRKVSWFGRVGLGGAVALLAVFGFAGAVGAHVTVDPNRAPKGGEVTLGFRVPNEESAATTVKVQIVFPSDHPILGAIGAVAGLSALALVLVRRRA